jgi:N-acetylglucosaminyldiphosphoundecaprenol N-acetyl-beta-D-mannosaminyltransferase
MEGLFDGRIAGGDRDRMGTVEEARGADRHRESSNGERSDTAARVRIAGVPAARVTMEEAVERVDRAAVGERPYRVLVTNANKAWQAARDPRLREILESAELAVPEWAMAWAARRLGLEGVHHVGGITLMARVLELAEARGRSVYLLGGKRDVVEALAGRLARERPGLQVVGWRDGYPDDDGWEATVAEIGALRPDLLFVAMGSPLQELRIAELAERVPTLRVAMGVGGSFDVLSGQKRDAPAWARGRGLEWLYRLAQDPARLWRRYLVTNAWFLVAVLKERLRA